MLRVNSSLLLGEADRFAHYRIAKRGCSIEQLNIEGKRSGDGFVAHKAMLVNALSMALAERIMLLDFTIGRKGLLNYLKSLGGSNVVKVVPSSNGNASGVRVIDKRLRVVCGSNTSYLAESVWIGDKTPLTLADVRVSPSNAVKPNIGTTELAEALTRVLPFTAKDDNRPVLACVLFAAKEGKLTLASADGFRLAVVTLPFEGEAGEALINREDLAGVANALKKAKRARVSFEANDSRLDGISNLILDTELIRYKWVSVDGKFPDYEKLIPTETDKVAHFDTVEAIKAVSSLKVLADSKSYPIDLTIGNGKVVMANTEDKGQAEIPADIDGEVRIRIDGGYLTQALKACGGMVELKLTNGYSPMLFITNGYKVVVMPMMTTESSEAMKREKEEADKAKAEAVIRAESEAEVSQPTETPPAETTETVAEQAETTETAEVVAEAEAIVAEKPKRKRKAKEPVAVA